MFYTDALSPPFRAAAFPYLGQPLRKVRVEHPCPAPDRWHCIRWILFRQDGAILSESPTNALHCDCFRLQSQGDCSQSDVTATIRGSKGLLTTAPRSFLHCFRRKGNGRGHLRSTGNENLPDRCRHCSRPDSHGRPFHRYPRKLVIQQADSGATRAAQPDYHSHGWLSSIPCPSHGDRTGAGKLVGQRENQTHSHPNLLGTGMDGIIRAISRHGVKIPIFLCVSFWAFGKNQVKSNIPPLLFEQNFAIIERVLSTPIKNSLEESVMRADPYPRRWMQDQK